MEPKDFLMVEDEAMIRQLLRPLLQTEPFVRNIYEARNRDEFEALLSKNIDIVLLDMKLRETHGLDLIPIIKKKSKDIKIIVVTGKEGKQLMSDLVDLGVHGIVYKLEGYTELRKAILESIRGKCYLTPRALEILVESRPEYKKGHAIKKLKKTDHEILRHIAAGLTSKDIAKKCKMTLETVETYRKRLLQKANVPNTAALLVWAYENGLL
jgi:DNA-binding NarL/FixJ family response regulator